MATSQILIDRINNIQTLDEAMPFFKALPINVIKIFLSKSAKYGFFDKVSFDDNQTEIIEEHNEIDNKQNDTESDNDDTLISKRSEYSFKLNKTNKRLFDVIEYGTTLKGNFKKDIKYPSNHWKNNRKLHKFGTAMFATFFQKPRKLTIHIKLNKNIINNAIGFGFITMKYNQFINETYNVGNNHSAILYGDGRYYTSFEFVNDSYQHDTILKPFINYLKKGQIIVIELDMKSNESVAKIYNIKHIDDISKHFIVSLKTTNNAIVVSANITFKPSITVIKQTIE